ncbi:MAG: helix-turn-helix domain-containing protein [Dehalococcoidia bacterium]
MQKRYEQPCPIARTLDFIGDRWTLLVLRDMFMGLSRFNEILANSPGMSPRLLSQRLKFLLDKGLIEREVYSEYPPRSQYVLTERGRSLFPVLRAIGEWGVEHLYEGEEQLAERVVDAVSAIAPELTGPKEGKTWRKTVITPRRKSNRKRSVTTSK